MQDIETFLVQETATILSLSPTEIDPVAELHTLGIDSLGFVELLIVIEKEFNLNLMESGLGREDLRTIRSLASCIGRMG